MKHFYWCLLLWSGLAYGQESAVRTIGEAPDTSTVFVHVTQLPEPPGGMLAFQKSLVEQITYPPSAIADRAEGRVFVEVIVEKNGQLLPEHVQIVRGVHPALDEEALRVMRRSPRWRPGTHEGQVVRVKMVVPIFFTLGQAVDDKAVELAADLPKSDAGSAAVDSPATRQAQSDEATFVIVEQQPEFPGGMKALYVWLSKEIYYPDQARQARIEGRVLVDFVVGKDGNLREVEVARGIDPELDSIAVQMMRRCPPWTPGLQRGEPVSVKMTLPVLFRLNDSASPKRKKKPKQ